jgi:proteasome lid subunit RPN8/RPN11
MVEAPMDVRGTWQVMQSPVSIHYSRRMLEDVRLAVVDAFFSLPRGGVEVGGVLVGKRLEQEIEIADYVPIDCEHAFGPSFTLSQRDVERLREALQTIREKGGQEAVGWYHSHNRSGIFLSESDLEIHRRFFPEPWQIALVLRPHLSQPMRAGFFVREADGSMGAANSYREFVVEPFRGLEVNGVPTNGPATAQPAAEARPVKESAVAASAPVEHPAAALLGPPRQPERPAIPLPSFLQAALKAEAPKPRRKFWIASAVVAVSVMGILGLVALGPQVLSRGAIWNAAGSAGSQNAGWMNVLDSDGQLQIRWDTGSRAVEKARAAVLLVSDGGEQQRISLDPAQLRAGSLTYTRHSGRVDARLTIDTEGGPFETATTFLGATPAALEAEAAASSAEAAALERQNEELRKQNTNLESQVKTLAAQLEELRKASEKKRPSEANRFYDPLD